MSLWALGEGSAADIMLQALRAEPRLGLSVDDLAYLANTSKDNTRRVLARLVLQGYPLQRDSDGDWTYGE